MNELARQLDETIEHLVQAHHWTSDDLPVICAMQAVAQRAMAYHYGGDGVAAFNALADTHDHITGKE